MTDSYTGCFQKIRRPKISKEIWPAQYSQLLPGKKKKKKQHNLIHNYSIYNVKIAPCFPFKIINKTALILELLS